MNYERSPLSAGSKAQQLESVFSKAISNKTSRSSGSFKRIVSDFGEPKTRQSQGGKPMKRLKVKLI